MKKVDASWHGSRVWEAQRIATQLLRRARALQAVLGLCQVMLGMGLIHVYHTHLHQILESEVISCFSCSKNILKNDWHLKPTEADHLTLNTWGHWMNFLGHDLDPGMLRCTSRGWQASGLSPSCTYSYRKGQMTPWTARENTRMPSINDTILSTSRGHTGPRLLPKPMGRPSIQELLQKFPHDRASPWEAKDPLHNSINPNAHTSSMRLWNQVPRLRVSL